MERDNDNRRLRGTGIMKRLSMREFGKLVRQVMETLPKEFEPYLHNVVVDVADERTRSCCGKRASLRTRSPDGETPLGLFEPLNLPSMSWRRRRRSARPATPPVDLQTPHEEEYPDLKRLRTEIRKTVIHELAYHFGWTDRDLENSTTIPTVRRRYDQRATNIIARLHRHPSRASMPRPPRLLLSFCSHLAAAENWPGGAGLDGMGHSTDKNRCSPGATENVRWKSLPDTGNATPVVWGNRIFITQATGQHHARVICPNRENGKLIWKKYVDFAGQEPTHDTNPTVRPARDRRRASSLVSGRPASIAGPSMARTAERLGNSFTSGARRPVIHGDRVTSGAARASASSRCVEQKDRRRSVAQDIPGGKSGLKGKEKGGTEDWIGLRGARR